MTQNNVKFAFSEAQDEVIRQRWNDPSITIEGIGDLFGVSYGVVRRRALELGLMPRGRKKRATFSSDEWMRLASKRAREAGLRPATVLSGFRKSSYAVVRWLAWRDALIQNPGLPVVAVARASGYDHTTVIYGLGALAIREAQGQVEG